MKERDVRIDFYRGVLMWGVIWGHAIVWLSAASAAVPDLWIHRLFRTYDMPFFMFISGSLFADTIRNRGAGWRVLFDKLTQLVIPACLWGLLISSFRTAETLYFLWAVFGSCVLMTLIAKIGNVVARLLVVVIVTIALHCVPAPMANLSYLFPFFAVGFVFPTLIHRPYHHAFFCISLCFFVLLFAFWKLEYNVWHAPVYLPSDMDRGSLLFSWE